MNATPKYDEAKRLVAELLATFEDEGEAIEDLNERLAYYATLARGMVQVERNFVQIRLRAEDYMNARLLLAGMIPKRYQTKRVLKAALDLSLKGTR